MRIFKKTLTAVLVGSLTIPAGTLVPVTKAYAQSSEQPATEQPVSENTADLAALTGASERQTARLITTVRRSPEPAFAADTETGKPVWASLKELNGAAAELANAAALKDDSFHKALGDMVSRTAAAATAIEITGAEDAQVSDAKEALIATVGEIQENFSKSASRSRQGGELSGEEKAQLDKIRKNQKALQARLNAMEAKVKNNKRALEGLREVRRRSERITGSGYAVGDFLAALVSIRIIDGLLWGCHWWWGPWGIWYPGYSVVIVDIHSDIVADIAYDWDYYGDLAVDVGDLALADDLEAVDVYAADEAIGAFDVDLSDGLDAAALEGLEDVTVDDIADPAFGLADAMAADALDEGLGEGLGEELGEGLDTGAEALDLGSEALDAESLDMGSAVGETDLEGAADLDMGSVEGAEEALNEAIDVAPVQDLDLAPEPQMDLGGSDLGGMVDSLPVDDLGGGFDDGGFDSGGFDDFGGGGFDMDMGMDGLDGGFDFD